MPAFKTIALIGRYDSPDVASALATMGDYLRRQGREVLVEKETAASNHVSGFPVADYDEIGARADLVVVQGGDGSMLNAARNLRSEEHTSELQSRGHLVCRLLLEKKNKHQT